MSYHLSLLKNKKISRKILKKEIKTKKAKKYFRPKKAQTHILHLLWNQYNKTNSLKKYRTKGYRSTFELLLDIVNNCPTMQSKSKQTRRAVHCTLSQLRCICGAYKQINWPTNCLPIHTHRHWCIQYKKPQKNINKNRQHVQPLLQTNLQEAEEAPLIERAWLTALRACCTGYVKVHRQTSSYRRKPKATKQCHVADPTGPASINK